ncbi:hypothetical protein EAY16_19085, partial [Vibrio anguillarum]|uniref:hypothetical protein n=1 Tax=Vibrio anguillarum TaxID=55601 RepID=UPI001BE43CA8
AYRDRYQVVRNYQRIFCAALKSLALALAFLESIVSRNTTFDEVSFEFLCVLLCCGEDAVASLF